MKLLTMPQRSTNAPSSQANVLDKVWAVEGNLALAAAVMQSPLPQLAASAAESPAVPRSPFRVVITPQTAFYRSYTESMLRRYGVMSLNKSRVPTLLGRELFRGKVSSYRMHGFDDVIIFITDVERCLALLTPEQRKLVIRVAVQEYTLPETAASLRWSLRSTERRYHEAIDELTAIFQKRGLMEKTTGLSLPPANSCQEEAEKGVAVTYAE